ncbi:hypothetical protein [Luteimonas sp. FCS-9]|uniref:hypothetical protein n=1 Tax=Luteimonas sp. FCS-9 TaxID=1547516 RepID=UPI0006995B52|nr:hypothetical protein [Luteimonas sp. FCS-9]
MRQVFSSARLENVERVADLLRAEGIEVQISNGRSYKGNRRGTFSYRDQAGGPRPAVWVTRSEDQPRARALLRDTGLLQTQPSTRSYLAQGELTFAADTAPPPRRGLTRAAKIRYGLLGGAVLVIALSWWSRPSPEAPAPAPTAPVADQGPALDMLPQTVEAGVHRIPVPQALAATVLADALGARSGPVCVAVDGHAPTAPVLAELEAVHPQVLPASACSGGDGQAAWLEIRNYRTDGSGRGTVELSSGGTDATQGLITHTLEVRRQGRDWRFAPAG